MILIGQVGFILEGKDSGKYILVIDDTAETGGYYIFLGNAPNFNNPQYQGEVYDYWLENKEDLNLFFLDIKIQWNQP